MAQLGFLKGSEMVRLGLSKELKWYSLASSKKEMVQLGFLKELKWHSSPFKKKGNGTTRLL